MTASLLDSRRCLRVGAKRAWHLPHLVLAADEKSWELHTQCGLDLTGVEHTDATTIPTCPACLEVGAQ